MKRLTAILLAMIIALGLAACGDSGTPTTTGDTAATEETTAADAAETEAETEATPAEDAFDATEITSDAYGSANATLVAYLAFDGSNATLNLLKDGTATTYSGACVITAETITIDGTEFTYKKLGTTLKLTAGDESYSLSKATDVTGPKYEGAFNFLTNNWSGDGASVSFADGKMTLTIDGTSINYTGTFTMDDANSYTLTDENGDPANQTNLALDCATTESSVETESLPSAYAVDGDITTRWASQYSDPEWMVIDFGKAVTFGAVAINFEAAYSVEYELQVSDDNENWTTVFTCSDNDVGASPAGDYVYDTFASTTAQYLRFYGISRGTTYGHSIWELEVYESLGIVGMTVEYGDTMALTVNGTTYNLSK